MIDWKYYYYIQILLLLWYSHTVCGVVSVYEFRVLEEQSAGLIVGKIELLQSRDNISIVFSEKRFSLLVRLDFVSGNVITKQPIDRETLQTDRIFFIVIQSLNSTIVTTTEVTIHIEDLNDNYPTFQQGIQNILIPESAIINQRFRLQPAYDLDNGFNGFISNISLESTSGISQPFKLEYKANEKLLCLVVTQTLNREIQANYLLKIIASDNGNPPKVGHGKVNISIIDKNDEKPKFEKDQIDIDIPEAEENAVPKFIISLNVTDADVGLNSLITYTLSGANADFFEIQSNGNLYLLQALHYETIQKFDLVVKATDNGDVQLSSQASLKINVIDLNNHEPRIDVDRGNRINIREDITPNTILSLVITVSDDDTSTANGPLTLSILNKNTPFKVETTNKFMHTNNLRVPAKKALTIHQYILKVTQRLDRETKDFYNLTLQVTDNMHISVLFLLITVTDVNDNQPIFDRLSYNISVPAYTSVGSYILSVLAIDKDISNNGRVSYELQNTLHSNFFAISGKNGVILSTQKLTSFSTIPSFITLNISAKDSGSPVHMSFVAVRIYLTNRDKLCVPIVTDYPKAINVTDNSPTQSYLAAYKSQCNHKSTNIIYSLENNPNYLFGINEYGDLYLNQKPLSRTTFTLKVIAWNILNTLLKTTIPTLVTVDMQPKDSFYFEKHFYMVTLPQQVDFRAPVTRTYIPNQAAVYYISDLNVTNDVSIDKISGNIYISQSFSKSNCLSFAVSAKFKTTKALARVFIAGSKDLMSFDDVYFERRTYSFEIDENSPIGSIVGHVILNNPTTYSHKLFIENASEREIITVSNEGYLTVMKSIDREILSGVRLVIVAVVNCTVTRTNILITISDINDNAPFFTSKNIVFVKPSVRPSTTIYHATAKDIDFASDALLKYELLNNGNGYFCIKSDNGHIHLIKTLQPGLVYRLKLRVFDQGMPRMYSIMSLIVIVNTSQLLSSNPVFREFLSKHNSLNYPFYRLLSNVFDSTSSFLLISHGNDFEMYPNGWIYLKNETVRSRQISTYHLQCQQVTTSQRHLNFNITLYVDRIGSDSLFTNLTYFFYLTEINPVLSSIGEITLKEHVGIVVLYIQDNIDSFISLENTTLKINRKLDCSQIKDRFGSCRILLQIHGVTTDSESTCVVVIEIQDENNNGPMFDNKHVTIDISKQGSVSLIQAKDADTFPNNRIQYRLLSNYNIFTINSQSGAMTLLPLVKPKLNVYIVKVLAYDPSNHSLNDSIEVFINVIDRTPKLSTSSIANLTRVLHLPENIMIGIVVLKFNTANSDRHLYSLSSDSTKQHFVIHPNTGALQLIKSLDYETKKSFVLSVTINDLYVSDKKYIQVFVQDINDNAPLLKQTIIDLIVKDTVSVDSIIHTCSATDLDSDSVLMYSIDLPVTLEEFFILHTNNCSLRLIKSLKDCGYTSGHLQIKISDGVHETFLSVNMIIQRWSAPVIISPSAVIIPDNVQVNQNLYLTKVKSIYNEAGIRYSLTNTYSNVISLNATSGELILTSKWPTHLWNFQVEIRTTSKYKATTDFKLRLFKEESIKSYLAFHHQQYVRSSNENNPKGYHIFDVVAKYPNKVTGSNINYFITSGDVKRRFKIDQKSGKITIPKSLDREMIGPKVVFIVHAIDMGSSISHTALTTIEIRINDKNDNQPKFEYDDVKIHVSENTPNHVIVAKVTATDADQNSISYGIVSGNEAKKFSIDRQNGSINLTNTLDREETSNYILNISAKDDGVPPITSYTTLTVYVTDINDRSPSFNQSNYFFNVDEFIPKGTVIGGVLATDRDIGRNGEVYYRVIFGSYGYFAIDVTSGLISTTLELNCNEICIFVLIISAEDGGDTPLNSTTRLTIKVNSAKNTAFKFNAAIFNAVISEDVPVDSFVLSTELKSASNPVTSTQLYYSLYDNSNRFYVTENGSVYTKQRLDRECEENILFIVTVSSTVKAENMCQALSYATVNVTVTDVNDNAPYFQKKPIIKISEYAVVDSLVGKLNAFDHDIGLNSHLIYKNVTESPYVRVESNGRVILLKKLDFEEQEREFTIKVKVLDQGSPPQISKDTTVHVFVKDDNDNPPIILEHATNIKIPKDILPWKTFIQLNATDIDSDANGKLAYKLKTHTNVFVMNIQNGEVAVKNNNNLKSGDTFKLEIIVSDGGSPSLKTKTFLNVLVIEVNTPPQFSHRTYSTSIQENKLFTGTFFTVAANDSNNGIGAKFSYVISGSYPVTGYFSINTTTGSIIQLKPIDREEISYFNLTVTAIDEGIPPLSDNTTVYINVVDVNDFVPVILPNVTGGKIYENSNINTYVMTVQAYDLDSGSNGMLQYSLLNNGLNFKIDQQNGIVTSLRSFDYEVQSEYTLRVEVGDSAVPFHKNSREFIIYILDVNDTPPRFLKPGIMYIAADLPVGSFITRLETRDMDSSENSKMIYRLNSTNFWINEKTGTVTNSKEIKLKEYDFKATVVDPTYPYYNDTVTVILKVIDKTQFPIVQPSIWFARIFENDDTYTKVPIVRLKSKRFSNKLQYDIASSNTNLFSVNQTSGNLKLLSSLDYEAKCRHVVWVSLTDTNYPKLKSYSKIIVYVTNINDNIPKFTEGETLTISVEENSTNTSIVKVTATDEDELDPIYYSISNSISFFINKTTGIVHRKVSFDYEKQRSYVVNISAFNEEHGISIKYSTLMLLIDIININDNPPVLQGLNNITMSEDFPINTTFYTYNSSDIDQLQPLSFSVDSPYVSIDQNNGDLKLIKHLDHDKSNLVTFNVSVNDGVHVTSSKVTITVLDVNDSPPRFEIGNYIIKIKENTKEDTIIYQFKTIDNDSGINSISTFNFVSRDNSIESYFKLLQNGSLVVRKSPWIRGESRTFNFKIEAQNIVVPFYKAYSNVTVKIVDVNDHYPIFNQSVYTKYIQSNTQYRSTIMVVKALDELDIGDNSLITYTIIGGNGSSLFEMHDGEIRTKASLVAYESKVMTLQIKAGDKGIPSLSADCTMRIVIEGKNGYPPEIINGPFNLNVPEDTRLNHEVLCIQADDYDTRKILFFTIISGNEEQKWNIKNNGTLYIQNSLDYEKTKMYLLTVKVSDSTFSNQKSISTVVTINVTDVNDNAPMFTKTKYDITIPENFNIKLPILDISATDIDSAYSKVSYKLSPTFSFRINSSSGQLYGITPFDFEKESLFEFNVKAMDNGSPQKITSADVKISITGINEYQPKFIMNFYHFNISRIQQMGNIIGSVKATDKDKGLDGMCIYESAIPVSFGFSVNKSTGDITIVNKPLVGVYNYDVLAMNPGSTKVDIAYVKIQVYDVTPAPVFTNQSYVVSVKENVKIGSIILNIIAKHYDGDSGLIYELTNNTSVFTLNSRTGGLQVMTLLDREAKETYFLRASARMKDSPRAYTSIYVTVLDVNDNAPSLSSCYGNIVENTPAGFIIKTLNATDLDAHPNAGPFKFSLKENLNKFKINPSSGVIQNTVKLDREENSAYELIVSVTDNGTPTRSSNIKCHINVIDVNDNQGKSRVLTIYSTQTSYKEMNVLGDVSPIDADSNDKYNCSLITPTVRLKFNKSSCCLRMTSHENHESDMVLKYWGQHKNERKIESSVKLVFRDIKPSWLSNYVTVYISNYRTQTFVARKFFIMESLVNTMLKKNGVLSRAYIASVQDYQQGVIIVLVLNTPSKIYRELFLHLLEKELNTMNTILEHPERFQIFDACVFHFCKKYLICSFELKFYGYNIVNTDQFVYHSRNLTVENTCRCPAGSTGWECLQKPTKCESKPCFNNGKCEQVDENQVKCECSKYFQGAYCHEDVNECDHSSCGNGGNCINKNGGFFCECPLNFQGELCEFEISPCQPNPCSNNASCTVVSETNFKCSCLFGDSGKKCDTSSFNFGAASYMKLSEKLIVLNYNFSVNFATVEKEMLILFGYLNDFTMVVTIEGGYIKVWMGTSTVSVVTNSEVVVSDGLFHALDLYVNKKEIIIIVDERSKSIKSHGLSNSVQFTSLYIGGIKTIKDLNQMHAGSSSSVEFIGCMRHIKLNNITVNTSSVPHESNGVTVGCKRQKPCLDNPCGFGNECIDRWSGYECRCYGNYIAKNCMRDYKATRISTAEDSVIRLSLTESQRKKELLKKNIRVRRETLLLRSESYISIAFRTRKKVGVIFNSTDEAGDKTLIYLSNGQVQYRFEMNGRSGDSSLTQKADNGDWHYLDVSTQGKTTSLTLDKYHTTKYTFPVETHQFINQGVSEYLLGRDFIGCFGRINLNNDTLYLSESTSLYTVTKPKSTELGCIPTDVCSHSPCQNQTLNYCVDQWEKYSCVKPGLCQNKPCKNGGHCVPSNSTSFTCNCIRTYFGGLFCDTPLVCIRKPCQSNEQCMSNGPTYECITSVSGTPDTSEKISVVITIIIVIATVVGITLFALLIAFLSSRRGWKMKRPDSVDFTVDGFNNDAMEPESVKSKPLGTQHQVMQNNAVKKPSHQSLPDLRERSFSILNARYKSMEIPPHNRNNIIPESNQDIPHYQSRERLVQSRDVSNESINTHHGSDHENFQPFESGFESYSDVDSYTGVVSQQEMYDLDCASMQFSEMSFQYDMPSLRNEPNRLSYGNNDIDSTYTETAFCSPASELSYSTESDSEAYFTCSECEYGQSRQNIRGGKRNPGYVISHSNPLDRCKECDLVSETSSYNTSTSFSNTDSALSTLRKTNNHHPQHQQHIQQPRRQRRHSRRNSNLRQKVLASKVIDQNGIIINRKDDGYVNNSYELENVPEAEEYV